ncbi:MAG: TonB-dependent receptor, partial [Kangiellaceae bacterium]|nr:TonB-dependent receptor [Kangiellaceae bacterium]
FRQQFQDLVDAEIYNPFIPGGGPLVTQEHLDSFLHTNYRVAKAKTQSYGITWSADTEIELGGGTLSYVVGYESHDEEFSDIQDKQTNAGNVGGAFGGDSGGARDYSAVFAEVELPLLDELTVNLSTRNDSYSLPDESSQTSSAKIAYRPMDDLLIRASYSEGFRAPSLDNLLAGAAVSFDTVYDPSCAGQDNCPSEQVERHSTGNIALRPEESVQQSFGIVYTPIEDLTFAIDYYNIEIENQVSYIGAQSVLALDFRGELGPFAEAGCGIQYNGAGTTFDDIDVINACYGNSEGYNTSGIDFDATYRMDLAELGTLNFQFIGTKVNEWSFKQNPDSPRFDWVGFNGVPELRYTLSTGWAYDAFYVGLSYNHVKGFLGERPDLPDAEVGDFGDFNTIDLNVNYDMDEYGRIAFGARNLTDEMPTLNREEMLFPGYDENNHDIHGRVVYASYSLDF